MEPQHRTADVRDFRPSHLRGAARYSRAAPSGARGLCAGSRRRARCRSPAGPAAEGQGALPAAAERGGEPRGSAPPPLPAPPPLLRGGGGGGGGGARGGRGGAAGPGGARPCPLGAAPPRAELPQGPPRAPPPGRAARGMKLRPSGAGGPGCVSPAGP